MDPTTEVVTGEHATEARISRADLLRLALVGFAAAVSWTGIAPRFDGIDPISLAAAFVGGYPVFREAVDNLVARRMTGDWAPESAARRRYACHFRTYLHSEFQPGSSFLVPANPVEQTIAFCRPSAGPRQPPAMALRQNAQPNCAW